MFNRVERARTRNKVLLQKPAFISQLLSVLFSFVKYWIIWPLWASNCWEDETKNTPLYKFCRRVSKEKGMLRWMLNRISCRATVWDHRLNGSVIHLINSLLGKKKQLSDTVLLTKDVFISFKWTVSTAFPSVCSSSPTGPTCVFMHMHLCWWLTALWPSRCGYVVDVCVRFKYISRKARYSVVLIRSFCRISGSVQRCLSIWPAATLALLSQHSYWLQFELNGFPHYWAIDSKTRA